MSAMTYIPVSYTIPNTTEYKTDYVQECLVERDNKEILQKYLQGVQLTEEESKTVTDCVTEKKEREDMGSLIGWIIGVMLILGLMIFLIVSKIKGY